MNKIACIFLIMIAVACHNKKEIKIKQDLNIKEFISNYKYSENTTDSLLVNKIRDQIDVDSGRYIVYRYGYLFKSKYKYMVVLDQGSSNLYYWFKKSNTGFINLLSTERKYPLKKDSIYDFNKDGLNDLVIHEKINSNNLIRVSLMDINGLIKKEMIFNNYYSLGDKRFILVVRDNSPIIKMLKCEWKGSETDTIENLSYDWNNGNRTVYYLFKQNCGFEIDDNGNYKVNKSKVVKEMKNLPEDYIHALNEFYPHLLKSKTLN